MLTFLFWNLNKQLLIDRLRRLVETHSPDVIALAESRLDPAETVAALAESAFGGYDFPPTDSQKIQLYTRSSVGSVAEQYVDAPGNLSIRRLDLPRAPSILLAVLHAPAKGPWGRDSQAGHASQLAQDIRLVERDVGHTRTILVGDLNMNPYEAGVCGAHGLNAAMTRRQAGMEGRVVQGRTFPFLYNPMWGCFGDRSPGPPGTYYHRSTPPEGHGWNIYDQVLLRPSLMDKLKMVEILTSDGVESLVTSDGIPRSADGSDHLPLLFQLDV